MKSFALLIFLVGSLALAETSAHITKAAEIFNSLGDKNSKITIPADKENYLNPLLVNFKTKDKKVDPEDVKKVWSLAADTKLKCSGYAKDRILPGITGLLDISKQMEAEILKEKSWSKSIDATRMWNKMAFCDHTIIESSVYQSILKNYLETMSQLDRSKLTKEQAEELKKLKMDILTNTKTFTISSTLRFEIFGMAVLVLANQDEHKSILSDEEKIELSNAVYADLFSQLSGDPLFKMKNEESLAAVRALYDATNNPKASFADFKKISGAQEGRYLLELLEKLKLKDQGIKNVDDLKNVEKVKALNVKLKEDNKLLKEKQKLFARMNPHEVYLGAFVLPGIFGHFDEKLDEKFAKRIDTIRELANKL